VGDISLFDVRAAGLEKLEIRQSQGIRDGSGKN